VVDLAQVACGGLACSINPVHTLPHGATLFPIVTGKAGRPAGMMLLITLAAEVTAGAVVRAALAKTGLHSGGTTWPAACD